MKLKLLLFSSLYLLNFCKANNNVVSPSPKALSPSQADSIKKYLKDFPDNTQLSIAIINNDAVNYIGVKKQKDSLIYVDNKDSIFEVGSVTKVFTSVLLSKFVNDGVVKLDDPIKNYFDFPLKQSNLGGKEITLLNLSNHTSGLPRVDVAPMLVAKDPMNPYADYDEKTLKTYLQDRMKLDTIPGTKFSYSNLGGGLLGYILCKKANKTYEELLQENIFIPFGMKSTTTDLSKVKTGLIRGQMPDGTPAENWTFTDASAGAGAIKSNCIDMARFIQGNFGNNKVLELPRQKTFHIKENMDIGLAWIMKEKGEKTTYWHNGGTMGYRTCIAMDTTLKKGIVILSNVSAGNKKNENIDKLCFSLLD
jgi:CubicO group peptidase (beta-lactamase class C family)